MEETEGTDYVAFNDDFFSYLEYHLGRTFRNSDRIDLKGFWCDGISGNIMPDSQLSKASLQESKKIETIAWLGKTGQDEYLMTIKLGDNSLHRCMIGEDLIPTIPSEKSMDWITVYPDKRIIEINLQ